MRFAELVSEGPIDSIKNSWNAGANAAHKLATPSRWLEPSGSAPSAPAQKKSPTSTLGITRANRSDALAIFNAVETSKLAPSQQQLLDLIKNKIDKL
jgi:hypothetical protein